MFENILTAEFKQGEILVSKMKHSNSPCFPIYISLFKITVKIEFPQGGFEKYLKSFIMIWKDPQEKKSKEKKNKEDIFHLENGT